MAEGIAQQERAVESGYWPLFRYDPRKVAAGESPLKLDSPAPKLALAEFTGQENRFKQVAQAYPDQWKRFLDEAQKGVKERYALYEQLARAMSPQNLVPGGATPTNGAPKSRV
jgi:pyruvate-ferredoxin/flavodoxin oxidoreductase